MSREQHEDNCRCFVSYGYPSKEVGNVDYNSLPDLAPAFSQYGTIVKIDYIETKPIAFVEFTTTESAAFAIYNLNGSIHQGRRLKVSWAKPKEDEAEKKKRVDGEDGVEGEKDKEKKEEKKVTEIARPETPVGGMRVDTDDKPKKKKRAQKNKKNMVREIQYPSIETPPSTPPTQTNQTKQNNQNNQQQESPPTQNQNTGGKKSQQNNQQNKNQNTGGKNQQNKNQQNKNQNTGGKKKGRQQNFEIVIRNVDTEENLVVATFTDNGPEITDQENFDKFLVDFGLTYENKN